MTYQQRLLREFVALRRLRVQLHRRIEWLKTHTVQDATETCRQRRDAELALRATQSEWERLCAATGQEHLLGPAVKLNVRPRRATGAIKLPTRVSPRSAGTSLTFKTAADYRKWAEQSARDHRSQLRSRG